MNFFWAQKARKALTAILQISPCLLVYLCYLFMHRKSMLIAPPDYHPPGQLVVACVNKIYFSIFLFKTNLFFYFSFQTNLIGSSNMQLRVVIPSVLRHTNSTVRNFSSTVLTLHLVSCTYTASLHCTLHLYLAK